MRTIPDNDHRNFNAPSTWIPLFAITIGTTTYYYTPNPEAITVDGQTYTPFPVMLNEIREDGKGEISTVELTVANIGGALATAVKEADGIDGTTVVFSVCALRGTGAGDVAGQGVPYASSWTTGHEPARALAAVSGYWEAEIALGYQSWRVDFGTAAPRIITDLSICPYDADSALPKDFRLEGSLDGITWTTLLTDTLAETATLQPFTVPNTTAYRYYRFFIVSMYAEGRPAIAEIRMADASLSVVYTETLEIIECGNITATSITFKLGTFNPYLIQIALDRFQKDYCPNTYKGAGCWIKLSDGTFTSPSGFTAGSPDTCAKSLAECQRHTNTERFRGYPGIPGVAFVGV